MKTETNPCSFYGCASTYSQQIFPIQPVNRATATTAQPPIDLSPLEQALNAETTNAASHDLAPRASIPKTEDEFFKRKQQAVRTKTIFPVPLERETRVALPTPEAAFHLNRAQQTLRGWACKEDGPLRPLRINGRLAWPVSELRRVLGVA